MDQTTHSTSEIPVPEGNVADGSAPLIDKSPPPSQIPVAEGNVSGGSAPLTDASSPSSSQTSVKKDLDIKMEISENEKKEIASFVKKCMEINGISLEPSEGVPAGITFCNNENSLAYIRREDREYHVKRFRSQYSYGTTAHGWGSTNPFVGTIEDRTCIWSHFIRSRMEKSSGIMWVGVQGLESICVVTRSEHLDWNRVHGGLASTDAKTVLSLFRKCLISEIEDLADPSSELRKRINWSIEKPFGVVSVCPDTIETHRESGHETSSVGYDDKKAIKFLQDKMTSETSFTVDETIQTAISAFQHLFQKKFEAKEIEVSVTHDKNPGIKDLEISQIENYVAAINKSSSGETEEHVAVIDDPAPPAKKKKTNLVPEPQVPTPGGSTNTSETTD